ncbi:MAG: Cro/Cl family transcriptional regulator [Syntrophus sp. (in: bacteria)]|nr:Cro/Cl family transcriptional regulator [Syntrophus sp. (in: bacteria)]
MPQNEQTPSAAGELKIGGKVKELRERNFHTLHDLAAKTGVPKSVLSEIESDELMPPVATLLKLARALNVGMAYFFRDDAPVEQVSVTRAGERISVKRRPHHREGEVDYIYESLEARMPGKHMEPLLVEFVPMETAEMVFTSHEGEEFLFLLDGKLEFRSNDRVESLSAGDALYFDSGLNHSFRSLTDAPARALVVVWNRP